VSDRTKVTEIATGLGAIPSFDPWNSLPVKPPELRGVDEETWQLVHSAFSAGDLTDHAAAAFENGRALLAAVDGLRGRPPRTVEWHGPHGSPGDEVAPIDLRIDHVFLVSCKYLSKIVANPSPSHLFERLLLGRHGVRSQNWYDVVAPDEHVALFLAIRSMLPEIATIEHPGDVGVAQRRLLKTRLAAGWPDGATALYHELAAKVSERSAARWRAELSTRAARESMLWRLLRIGSAPYFVLGSSSHGAMRLRVGSPWDWRQRFQFRDLEITPSQGGQAGVVWRGRYRDPEGQDATVEGHVEIRWSHGRFSGPPEAKVYLDTPHDAVPGYWPLT
jgi:hypothetical protein